MRDASAIHYDYGGGGGGTSSGFMGQRPAAPHVARGRTAARSTTMGWSLEAGRD